MSAAEFLAAQAADLAALRARDRYRALAPASGIDFASNDYLGLATSAELNAAARDALARGVPVGAGGSRLLRGNHPEHEALEAEATAFFGGEGFAGAALFMGSGFAANAALLATLPQRGDAIFADALIHASCHEGLRRTRAAHHLVAHNDVEAFAAAIAAWRAGGGVGQPWIVVESLYSMDGDLAPLGALIALAERARAMLVIDEAHATGVFGPGGRGLVAETIGSSPRPAPIITLHTLGKALGCEGALLVGPRVMRAFLINRARAFIYSTAPSPLAAAIARAALRLCAASDGLRAELMAHITLAQSLLAPFGAQGHGTPIVPLLLGEDARALAVAAWLAEAGFDVRAIRPPTVPEGTARLRIAITRNISQSDIRALAQALGQALAGAPGQARA